MTVDGSDVELVPYNSDPGAWATHFKGGVVPSVMFRCLIETLRVGSEASIFHPVISSLTLPALSRLAPPHSLPDEPDKFIQIIIHSSNSKDPRHRLLLLPNINANRTSSLL